MSAINGNLRLIHPPQNAAHTGVRRTSRMSPARRRALALAITGALLTGEGIAIDAAATTATTPPSTGTSFRPIGTNAGHLPNSPLGSTGLAPSLLSPGSSI